MTVVMPVDKEGKLILRKGKPSFMSTKYKRNRHFTGDFIDLHLD